MNHSAIFIIMSDTEEKMQTKASPGDSSGDESSSEAAKETSSRGRTMSSSSAGSSSSSEDAGPPKDPKSVDSEDESESSAAVVSKSEAKSSASEGEAPQPPQPRSRSVSVEEAAPAPAERKRSMASSVAEEDEDTDNEVEEPKEEVIEAVNVEAEVEAEPEQPPVPVERKASVDNELTSAEVELSKRETVHLDDQQKAEVVAEVTKEAEESSAASISASSSSSEDEEEVKEVEAKPATIIEAEVIDEKPSSQDERIASPEVNGGRPRSANTNGNITKTYTNALNNNNNNNNNNEKGERLKPTKDITQIYTQNIAKASPPASPRSMPRGRPAGDITKLYTGKLETGAKTAEPAEKISPKKHNMSTAVDKDAIRSAYEDVRSDTSDTEWAVFKFDESNRLGVTATGSDFSGFKSHFGSDERGFGYIRITTGDEMSKRAKFVLVTWVGQNVSVMKKAKMSTDKALMKDVIQNMSVELQLENHGEFSHDHFKMQVDKASGARYGTGVRDL